MNTPLSEQIRTFVSQLLDDIEADTGRRQHIDTDGSTHNAVISGAITDPYDVDGVTMHTLVLVNARSTGAWTIDTFQMPEHLARSIYSSLSNGCQEATDE